LTWGDQKKGKITTKKREEKLLRRTSYAGEKTNIPNLKKCGQKRNIYHREKKRQYKGGKRLRKKKNSRELKKS